MFSQNLMQEQKIAINKSLPHIDKERTFITEHQYQMQHLYSPYKHSIMKNQLEHESEILNLVLSNDLEKVETFLKNGANPNEIDRFGGTLLHNALVRGSKEMLLLLVKYKADPDIKNTAGESVIHFVARMKDIEAAKILIPLSKNIDQKTLSGYSSLYLSVNAGSKEITQLLLNKRADPNILDPQGNTPLHISTNKKTTEISIELLKAGANPNLSNSKKEVPLISAANFGMTELLKEMLNHGGDPNLSHTYFQNPMCIAINGNNIDVVKILLDKGANPNIEIKLNNSLLNLAVEKGNIEIVDILLRNGAKIQKINDFGDEALLIAAKSGNVSIVSRLLSAGAELNIQNTKTGKAPLHIATRQGHVELVKCLVEKGANLEIPDKEMITPIIEVLPQIYNWQYLPRPTQNQSEIANFLIEKGANLKPYETENFLMAQLADVINVKNPIHAREFMFSRVGKEWDKIDERRVDFLLNKFAKMPSISEKEIDKLLLDLLHPGINYKNEEEAIRHGSHLRSWRGNIVRPEQESIEAEGWYMHVYPPLKAKSLIMSLNKINNGQLDCMDKFGESKDDVIAKIKHEIASQMSTYYSQRHHDMMYMITNAKFADDFKNYEISKYCNEIIKAPVGKEWAIASGFPGHAIYIGFRKTDTDTVQRIVYNLGAGLGKHISRPDGMVFPHVVGNINVEHFINETPQAKAYIKGILDAKLGKVEPLTAVYDNAKILGGIVIEKDIPGIPQKRQLAGNCVLKNNNAAARNRFNNDRLFDHLKKEETAFADEMSKLEKNLISLKEKEKDIDSFNYIIKMYNSNKNLDATIENLVKFLEKRSKAPAEVVNKLRDIEKVALYLRNIDEKTVDTFMMQRGAVSMVKEMAERRYCDTLKYFLKKYEQSKTLNEMYKQAYNLPFGTYNKN